MLSVGDAVNYRKSKIILPEHALQSVCLQRLGPMVEYLRYNKDITSKHSAEAAEVYSSVVDTFFDEFD